MRDGTSVAEGVESVVVLEKSLVHRNKNKLTY